MRYEEPEKAYVLSQLGGPEFYGVVKAKPRPLDGKFVINAGENLNKGSGTLNDIFVAMTEDGKRVAVKIPRPRILPRTEPDTYDLMLDMEERKLISLEPYDGAHYYGRVNIMVNGQEKIGLAMEILEGVDISTILKSDNPPFKITDQHVQSIKDFINKIERAGKMLWDPNEGNFILSPGGKFRPIDMLVKERDIAPEMEISLSSLASIVQNLEKARDKAQISEHNVDRNGGIDLTSDQALKVENNGQKIKFHVNPGMLQQLQNAPGFTPVIINIQPMTDLRLFLGLKANKIDKFG